MSDTIDFLAWALRTTPKKVGKMHITELQDAWIKANLPPATLAMKDNKTGKTTPLFELGEPKKKRPTKKSR